MRNFMSSVRHAAPSRAPSACAALGEETQRHVIDVLLRDAVVAAHCVGVFYALLRVTSNALFALLVSAGQKLQYVSLTDGAIHVALDEKVGPVGMRLFGVPYRQAAMQR